MFDSKAFLWNGPLSTVWIAANFKKCKNLKVKLTRRDYCRTDIEEVCDTILETHVELTMGLSSHLLLGVVRIHNKQTHYILQDFEVLMKQFHFLEGKCFNHLIKRKRATTVTLPEYSFDTSFCSLYDLHIDSADISKYVLSMGAGVTGPVDPTRDSTQQPSPSYTADPKDISIVEELEEPNLLQDSLWDCMYFGDEDPALLADPNRTLLSNLPCSPIIDPPCPSGDTKPHLQVEMGPYPREFVGGSDPVLMYDEEHGSFEFSSGGATASGSSLDQSGGGSVGDGSMSPIGFEISPLAGSNHAHRITHLGLNDIAAEDEEKMREERGRRKRKKTQSLVDMETELQLDLMKLGMSDNTVVGIGKADYTKQFRRQAKAKDLLYRPFCNSVRHHVLLSSCKDALPVDELLATHAKSTTSHAEAAMPMAQKDTPSSVYHKTTPTSTPIFVRDGPKQMSGRMDLQLSAIRRGIEVNSGLEREVPRRVGGNEYSLSYEDPLRIQSYSDFTISRSRSGTSHQTSDVSSRLHHDLLISGDVRPDDPIGMGFLSPILDVGEQMEKDSESLDLPALEDSDTISPQSLLNASSSSTSSASEFSSHIANIMGGRTQLEFQELLPPDCTRRMASMAFAHILTLISKHKFLTVEQTEPYGAILLCRGKRF